MRSRKQNNVLVLPKMQCDIFGSSFDDGFDETVDTFEHAFSKAKFTSDDPGKDADIDDLRMVHSPRGPGAEPEEKNTDYVPEALDEWEQLMAEVHSDVKPDDRTVPPTGGLLVRPEESTETYVGVSEECSASPVVGMQSKQSFIASIKDTFVATPAPAVVADANTFIASVMATFGPCKTEEAIEPSETSTTAMGERPRKDSLGLPDLFPPE
jgi:hypothetical protein